MAKKILNIVSTVILVLLIVIVVLVFIARATGRSPSLFGYHVFRVSSESMTPTLNVEDVILVKEVPVEEIEEGDIITYVGLEGDFGGKTITHRVIVAPEEIDGVYYLQTKGDIEGASPDPRISYDQVEGKYVKTLPLIDKLYSFFLSPYGLIIFIFVIVALFGYEMISLIMSYKAIDEKDDDYYEPKPKKPRHRRKKNKK